MRIAQSIANGVRLWGAVMLLMVFVFGLALAREDPEKEPDDDPDEIPMEEDEEPTGRVTPWDNVGGHTGPIRDMVFSADGKRLYTVGLPGEVASWDIETGKRLRAWRFPRRMYRLAISLDGKLLASAGNTYEEKAQHTSIWLIDLESGEARSGPTIVGTHCHALAFAPDGKRLGAIVGSRTEIHDLSGKDKPIVLSSVTTARSLAFDPSGGLLVTADRQHKRGAGVHAWKVSTKGELRSLNLPVPAGEKVRVACLHDGRHISAMSKGRKPSIRVWSIDPTPKVIVAVDSTRLLKAFGKVEAGSCLPIGISFISKKEILASWNRGGWLKLVRLEMSKKERLEVLPTAIPHQEKRAGLVVVSPDGRTVAATSDPAYQVALYNLKTKKEIRRIGPFVEMPQVVGWTQKGHGIAWGYQRTKAEEKKWQSDLVNGLDLDTLEPLTREQLDDAGHGGLLRDWKLTREKGTLVRSRAGKQVKINLENAGPRLARMFKDASGKERLLVVFDHNRKIGLVDPNTGETISRIGKRIFFPVYDMAVSPDGKYLLVAGGNQAIEVYSLAKPNGLLLRLIPNERDWIVVTKEGYYAATPGGERLIGWRVVTDNDKPAAFYSAERFRKRLHKPEIIKALLQAGSLEAVLSRPKFKERAVDVEEMLPPRVTISVQQDAKERNKIVVEVSAEARAKDQPIEMLRLLVDGRPLPDSQGIKSLGKAQKATARWTIPKLPPGKLEIKVQARCPDVSGASAIRVVEVPPDPKDLPVLHLISVGLNYKGNKDLELGCPPNDATAIVKEFRSACVGPKNLFARASDPRLLLNKEGTAKSILAALAVAQKTVKPRDLLVFFYAGHGVREGKEFYLLTEGADLKDLAKTALSGADLGKAFADVPCRVLVLLDACHSGNAVRGLVGFKSATDDAARELADAECGVALIAAAMGHERALEPVGGANGLFTQAVLAALKPGPNVPRNHRDGQQYVQHLFSYVFAEVKETSKDRQHPFLSLPWTVEDFPVRKVN